MTATNIHYQIKVVTCEGAKTQILHAYDYDDYGKTLYMVQSSKYGVQNFDFIRDAMNIIDEILYDANKECLYGSLKEVKLIKLK